AEREQVQVPVLLSAGDPAKQRRERPELRGGRLGEDHATRLLPVISKGTVETAQRGVEVSARETTPLVFRQLLPEGLVVRFGKLGRRRVALPGLVGEPLAQPRGPQVRKLRGGEAQRRERGEPPLGHR